MIIYSKHVLVCVFQVETIGDAYCVAGGLHRKSKYHAQQIAWMGIKMMETAKNELSHDGNIIRVSIFLIFSHIFQKSILLH